METSNETGVFGPADTAPVVQPVGQGVILTLKCYSLRDILCKAIDAIDGGSMDGSGQVN